MKKHDESFYAKQMRKVETIFSGKLFRKFEDKLLTKGRGDEMWRLYERQQQEAFGFANIGGGITIPAAAIWWSSAWNNTTSYPAGTGGIPSNLSFVQVNGVVYAAPTTTPAGAPPGSTWVIQSPGPGMNGWQVNPYGKGSVWTNPGLTFPNPPAAAVDVVDSAWAIPDQQVCSTTAAQSYIPAPGIGFLIGTSAANPPSLQYNLNGSWTTAVTIGATVAFYIPVFLDGLTWRMLGAGTTLNTYNIFRSRQTIQS